MTTHEYREPFYVRVAFKCRNGHLSLATFLVMSRRDARYNARSLCRREWCDDQRLLRPCALGPTVSGPSWLRRHIDSDAGGRRGAPESAT